MSDLLPDAVLRYDDHEDGVLDVHLPTARPDSSHHEAQLAVPPGATRGEDAGGNVVVLLLHGGFWKTAYDRTHTRPMARALAAAGFIVATPEYRRVGPGGFGGWPTTGADVRRAATMLPGLLAGIGVEAQALRVIGHSAGGHLALWLAATGSPTGPVADLPIERTVALAPVCDVREALRLGLGSDAARAFFGELDHEHALRDADPMVLLDERPTGEVVVVHGVADDTVPVELSRGLARRHPWVDLREVPGGHYEVIEPDSAVWPTVLAALS